MDNLSVPQHRSGQKQCIDAVEDASMAGKQGAGILDTGGSFEGRLRQIADLGCHVYEGGEEQPVPPDFFRERELEGVPLGEEGTEAE